MPNIEDGSRRRPDVMSRLEQQPKTVNVRERGVMGGVGGSENDQDPILQRAQELRLTGQLNQFKKNGWSADGAKSEVGDQIGDLLRRRVISPDVADQLKARMGRLIDETLASGEPKASGTEAVPFSGLGKPGGRSGSASGGDENIIDGDWTEEFGETHDTPINVSGGAGGRGGGGSTGDEGEGSGENLQGSWEQMWEVLKRGVEGGLNPEQVAKAKGYRNDWVRAAESRGYLDSVKSQVEGAYRSALTEYEREKREDPPNDTEDPRRLLTDRLERISVIEPGDPKFKGIVNAWVEGVTRNVDIFTTESEIAKRKYYDLPVESFDERQLAEWKKEAEFLNWPEGRKTKGLLRGLVDNRWEWLQNLGPDAKAFHGAMKRKEGVPGGATPPETKENPLTTSYEAYVNSLWGWEKDPYEHRLERNSPDWYLKLSEKDRKRMVAQERWLFAARAKMEGKSKIEDVVKNKELYGKMWRAEVKDFYESAGGQEALETMAQHFFEVRHVQGKNASGQVIWEADEIFFIGAPDKGGGKPQDGPYKDQISSLKQADTINAVREPMVKELMLNPAVVAEAGTRGITPEQVATEKVASAWNLLYIWNTFESADRDRQIATGSHAFSEAARQYFWPMRRFLYSVGLDPEKPPEGEIWGGSVGRHFRNHRDDPVGGGKTVGDLLLTRELRPFPEHMFMSLGEFIPDDGSDYVNPKTHKKEGKPILHRLILGEDIVWDKPNKTDPTRRESSMKIEWWEYYIYFWGMSNAILEYAKGKNEAGRTNDKWQAWGNDLGDAMEHNRANIPEISKQFLTYETLRWIVTNSLGVNPRESGTIPKISHRDYPHLNYAIQYMLGDPKIMNNPILNNIAINETGNYIFDIQDGFIVYDNDGEVVRDVNGNAVRNPRPNLVEADQERKKIVNDIKASLGATTWNSLKASAISVATK